MEQEDIRCHYFCLLFFFGLQQTGCEITSMAGFEVSDIKKSMEKVKKEKKKCCYCKELYPAAVCCKKKCLKRFHVPCAMKNNALMRFFESYQSFCDVHAKKLIVRAELPKKDQICLICRELLGEYNPVSCFQPKCCIEKIKEKKQEECWLHYRCVMEGTRHLGYYFNCFAYCCAKTDKETKQYYLDCGIFIPARDALYENQNYYDDIDGVEDEEYVETTYDEDATIFQRTFMNETGQVKCDYKKRCIGAKLGKADVVTCHAKNCQNFVHVKCIRYYRNIDSNQLARQENFFCQSCFSKSCLSLV